MQLSETVKLYPTEYQSELIKATMSEYISTVNRLVSDAVSGKSGYLKFWVKFASSSIFQINTFFKEKGGKICFPPFIMVKFNYKVFGGKER